MIDETDVREDFYRPDRELSAPVKTVVEVVPTPVQKIAVPTGGASKAVISIQDFSAQFADQATSKSLSERVSKHDLFLQTHNRFWCNQN